MVTPGHKEQCVTYAKQKYQITHTRACRLMSCSRKNKYYQKQMPLKDRPIAELIGRVVGASRKGRKKVIPLVQRINPKLGASRIRRVYVQKGFSLMKRLKRRLRNSPANPATVPMQPNIEWAIDFMSDSLVSGRMIRSLNILDPFNRQCKGIYIRHSISSSRLIECLEISIEKYGKPRYLRSDHGPEMISKLFQKWLHDNGIGWQPIEKGKPQQNCYIERFNGTMRADFLDANLFYSDLDAQQRADQWIEEYNNMRPHESLNNRTPVDFAA